MKKLMMVLFSVLGINLVNSAMADGCGNSCDTSQTCEPSTSPITLYSCSGTAEWNAKATATATPTPCAQGLCLPGQTCQPLSQLQQTYSCVNNPLRPAPHKLHHHHNGPHGAKDSSD